MRIYRFNQTDRRGGKKAATISDDSFKKQIYFINASFAVFTSVPLFWL